MQTMFWTSIWALVLFTSGFHTNKTAKVIEIWKQIPKYLDESVLEEILSDVHNSSQVHAVEEFVAHMNANFNHSAVSFLEESSSDAPSESYAPVSGNPQCDIDVGGPKTVTRVIPGETSSNPMNQLPSFGFDLTGQTTKMMSQSSSGPSASAGSAGIVSMVGIMMVKSMVQATVATGISLVPPMIPPPVWNLMPFPCVPVINAPVCFGAVLYPITFADAVISDNSDSMLTGIMQEFRSTFKTRAGEQPNSVYQKCFKAYMSMYCSSIFPMCTAIQGRDEMIPFIGRVPMCFTSCLAVLLVCPGFSMVDIAGPCASVSIPPLCGQAVYMKDDLQGPQTIEDELEGKINSQCRDYNPEVDAGQDPYLYEEEPALKMISAPSDMQQYVE